VEIKSIRRPWQKTVNQGSTYTDTSFYRSAPWRALRARKLQINPFCECDDCNGKKVIADMVDHIIPIELGGAALDINNTQSMRNHPCHDRKRAREKNEKYKLHSKTSNP
jgi:5-methylcytosine-specific restriction endonuclease McrA